MLNKKIFDFVLLAIVYSAFAFIFWPFKQSLIFAALFAFALNPILNKILNLKKIKFTEIQAITILVLFLVTVLFVPLLLIVLKVAKTVAGLGQNNITDLPLFLKLQSVTNWAMESITHFSTQFDVDLSTQIDMKSIAAQAGQFIIGQLTSILSNIPAALFQTFIFILMLYFFLMNREKIKLNILKTEMLNHFQLQRLVGLFQNVCYLVLVSTLLIAFIQAIIVTFASALVGYDDVFIIFLIAFFMAFIPVIGSAPLTIALITYSALNGHYLQVSVMAFAAIIASVLDNIIKTYLFSSQKDSVHPILLLLGIIGSINVFGILGLFLGPIIMELASKIGLIILEEKEVEKIDQINTV